MKIDVRDNQIEPALKAMKKLMLKDGLFLLYWRLRVFYSLSFT